MNSLILAILLAQSAAPPPAMWNPAVRMEAQREAMKKLDFLDGTWRGPATASDAPGPLVQTERVGPLLDGTVKLVEGRGYDARGKTAFNAFAIISYDPVKRAYSLRSYSTGFVGDYPLTVRPDGFSWSHPAGPGASIRYTATVKDGEWHEVGERIAEGSPPVKAVELRVRRLGPSAWPQGGTVAPR